MCRYGPDRPKVFGERLLSIPNLVMECNEIPVGTHG